MKKLFTEILKITFLLIVITLLQSCATSAIPAEPMTFKKETTQNGLIIGSITFPKEKARYNSYFIKINNRNSNEKTAQKNSTEIQISPEQIIKMKHKGQLNNGLTYLFTIERPEGEYEIPSIRLFSNSGIAIMQRTDNSGNFSIPFDVKKGEITYVGNIVFNEYASKNDTLVKYQNNYNTDIEAIKKLQPSVDWNKAINDTNRTIKYNR